MTHDPLHIALHIGAHKTATTHLQRSLQQVRPKLKQAGVRYFGPIKLREKGQNLIDRFGLELRPGMPTTDHAAVLREMVGDAQRLVLSEENFAGSLQNRAGNIPMPLYPDAPRRVTMLAEKIAPHGLHLHLGIRNPTRFLTSAYCQALMGGKQVKLAVHKDKNPLEGVNWVDLVDRLVAAPGVASLTVWRHEDYSALFHPICLGLLGAAAATHVAPVAQMVHRGLSAAAVAELSLRPAEGLRDVATQVRGDLPVSAAHPAFDAYDSGEHAASQADYDRQTAQIAVMPGVTFLRP